MFNKKYLKLYFICGTQDCINKNFLEVLEDALRAGITAFQFREKGKNSLKGEAKKNIAIEAQKMCKQYNVPFIINDDIDLAIELDVDGVHIGQDDEPIEKVRELFPNKFIGLSISNMNEYKNSKLYLADYIGVGPIYSTISKDDASKECGLSLLEEIRLVDDTIPIVAIGGITADKTLDIIKSGADGVSVISAISRADDTYIAVKNFLNNINI